MRRTVSLVVAAGVLMVLGGVASGTPVPPAPGPVQGPVPSVVGSAGSASVVAGREQVGTVETVDAVLGYLDAERSMTFRYPGAEYVKVHLHRLLLLPGDYLTVADPDRAEVYRYEAEPLLGLGGAGRWAMSVTGDTAVVTLHTARPDPLGVRESLARLGVSVDKVARGFTAGEAPEPGPGPTGREETVCGGDNSRDAVCYRSRHPAIYRSSKAVVRLLINGIQMCSAFRVGPANRLLTNNHCIATSRDARSTEIWFNYQCAECDGWAVFRPTKVGGDQVLATDRVLDFTLFTVDDFARVERYGYLTLDPQPVKAGEEIYIPQHPGGAPAQVAMRSDRERGGNCGVANPRVHGYGWNSDVSYYCDTRAGSSGSPVLSRKTHRVIALHHFGGCPNSGVRIDLIHPRILAADQGEVHAS